MFGVVAPGGARELAGLDLAETFARPVDPDEVLLLAHTLLERRRLQRLTGIVGETDPIREALERVVQIAPVDSTVLITGESGTGKELFARGVHALSPRRHKAFIAVNVAALSPTVLESELFGHEKGAFTGAIDSRRGLFELANHGTIFLDEIGEIPPAMQTKLLRVLEQKEFLRVGGEAPIRVDARVIAATNQDVRHEVAAGRFRRDLYYRINVLHIELPPLRERADDVPRLVEAFVEEVSARNGRRFSGISDEAMRILQRYSWPGNVRELRNLVESMVVLSPGKEIGPRDIPPQVRSPGSSPLLPVPTPARDPKPGDAGQLRPELEFVFRTLVELRVDMDDLRREFDLYRREHSYGEALLPPETGRVEIVSSGHAAPDTTLDQAAPDPSRPDAPDPPAGAPPAQRPEASPGHPDPSPGQPDASPGQPPEIPLGQTADASPAASEAGSAELHAQPAAARGGSDAALGDAQVASGDSASGDSTSEASELPAQPEPAVSPGGVVFEPGMTLEDIERKAILTALEEVEGNRRLAARLLGIAERTLYRKLRRYGLE